MPNKITDGGLLLLDWSGGKLSIDKVEGSLTVEGDRVVIEDAADAEALCEFLQTWVGEKEAPSA